MAGIVGTIGMLAESSGYGAVVDVAAIPTPSTAGPDALGRDAVSVGTEAVSMGDWLGCFPGFGMVTADRPSESRMESAFARTAEVGSLVLERGVQLRWPDGEVTRVVAGGVTGLGPA